eukprot:6175181-Pleurochrysis_carterae.AAC.6
MRSTDRRRALKEQPCELSARAGVSAPARRLPQEEQPRGDLQRDAAAYGQQQLHRERGGVPVVLRTREKSGGGSEHGSSHAPVAYALALGRSALGRAAARARHTHGNAEGRMLTPEQAVTASLACAQTHGGTSAPDLSCEKRNAPAGGGRAGGGGLRPAAASTTERRRWSARRAREAVPGARLVRRARDDHLAGEADEHAREEPRLHGDNWLVQVGVGANGDAEEHGRLGGRARGEGVPVGARVEDAVLQHLAGAPRGRPDGDERRGAEQRAAGEAG